MTTPADRELDTCRCGVHRYAHDEGRGCGNFRRSRGLRLWLAQHGPIRHVTGWLWLNLRGDTARMNAAGRYHKRHPDLCWCDMVDAALLDGRKGDYRKPWGCGCYVPRLVDAGSPVPGHCYCEVAA